MKAGWQSKPLGDFCEFKNGLWKGKKEPFIHVGVIRNTNFTKEGFLDDSDIAYLDVEAKQFESRQLQFGDLVLEKSGGGPKQPVGRVIPFEKTEGKYSFSNFTSVIRVLHKDEVDYSFLHRYLNYLYSSGATEPLQKHSTGIRNLQLKEYKQLAIPLPPLPEQRRIVGILDEAFEGIAKAVANAEANLNNSHELFESHLNAIFSNPEPDWIEKTLEDLCEIKHGFAFKSKSFAKDNDEQKPIIITPGNFTEDGQLHFAATNTKRFVGKVPEELFFKQGELVIVMTDLSSKMKILGKPAFIDRDNILHNQRIGRIIFKDKLVIKEFLYYYLFSQAFINNIKASATGTMVKHTAPKRILSNVIPFPSSHPEQQAIVAKFDELAAETKHLKHIYQQKLALLAELKQSLLYKAFSGAL